MKTKLLRVHRYFRRWEPYLGLLIATGFFGWLGKKLKVFGELGWAESIFIGIFFAFLSAAALALYRYWRPLPAAGASANSPLVPESGGSTVTAAAAVIKPSPAAQLERLLNTCYIIADPSKLKSDGLIHLTVAAYNASPKTLILADVAGNVRCTVEEADGKQRQEKLGVPDLFRVGPSRQIPPFSEFVLTLHQSVSPHVAASILATVKSKAVMFDLEEVRLEFTPFQEAGPTARLKLWDGFNLATAKGGLRSGRVSALRVKPAS